MDEPRCDFDYTYARYVLECARNGNSPLAPDEFRALIEALARRQLGGAAKLTGFDLS